MTIQEVCQAIEAEFHTRSWKEMPLPLRLLVIQSCIEEWSGVGEPEQATKKGVKQRKTRQPKTKTAAPLTQHAVASQEVE